MKSSIHPEYMVTKVHCNGCNTTFETRSTVPSITVEICSNCHPFYTGKQKLVDTAGRVDRFNALRNRAEKFQADKSPKKSRKEEAQVQEIAAELKEDTVDLPKTEDK